MGRLPSTGRPQPTLATAMPGHDNAFGFLRLLFAFLVLLDHACRLGGFGESPFDAWARQQTSLGRLAVDGFFVISGFLVAKSALSHGWLQFLWRRALRLLPAFWVVLCIAAFAAGPCVWLAMHRPLGSYFALETDSPFGYVARNALLRIRQWGIGDSFVQTPFGQDSQMSSVNGSLWTLIYEWNCYLLLCGLALFGVLRRARLAVPLVALFFIGAAALWDGGPERIAHLLRITLETARFTGVFLLGSAAALYAGAIPVDDWLGALSLVLVLASLRFGGFLTLGSLALVYLVLWLAARLPRLLRPPFARNDYSYGVYLYGFLVEQCLAQARWNRWGRAVYIFAAVALSLGCALLSWHLVEKRALAWKDRGPGRRGGA